MKPAVSRVASWSGPQLVHSSHAVDKVQGYSPPTVGDLLL